VDSRKTTKIVGTLGYRRGEGIGTKKTKKLESEHGGRSPEEYKRQLTDCISGGHNRQKFSRPRLDKLKTTLISRICTFDVRAVTCERGEEYVPSPNEQT